jgi:hypothetical protein
LCFSQDSPGAVAPMLCRSSRAVTSCIVVLYRLLHPIVGQSGYSSIAQ